MIFRSWRVSCPLNVTNTYFNKLYDVGKRDRDKSVTEGNSYLSISWSLIIRNYLNVVFNLLSLNHEHFTCSYNPKIQSLVLHKTKVERKSRKYTMLSTRCSKYERWMILVLELTRQLYLFRWSNDEEYSYYNRHLYPLRRDLFYIQYRSILYFIYFRNTFRWCFCIDYIPFDIEYSEKNSFFFQMQLLFLLMASIR